ncbi:hypothetical protein MKY29_03675 [Psychrobacillus sp. FSL K6-2365]|uniref:hypothetical protein n=1 Tax=Psychrobacillus sp. FSL K6-2365 TaxID=2921546 RepID=UPI0030F65133
MAKACLLAFNTFLLALVLELLALTQRLLADRGILEVDCEENEKKKPVPLSTET